MKKIILLLICSVCVLLINCSKLDKRLFGQWRTFTLGKYTALKTFTFYSNGKFEYYFSWSVMNNPSINSITIGNWSMSNNIITLEAKQVSGFGNTIDNFQKTWKFESITENKASITETTNNTPVIYERIKILE